MWLIASVKSLKTYPGPCNILWMRGLEWFGGRDRGEGREEGGTYETQSTVLPPPPSSPSFTTRRLVMLKAGLCLLSMPLFTTLYVGSFTRYMEIIFKCWVFLLLDMFQGHYQYLRQPILHHNSWQRISFFFFFLIGFRSWPFKTWVRRWNIFLGVNLLRITAILKKLAPCAIQVGLFSLIWPFVCSTFSKFWALLFVCFVVINPRVLSANRVDLVFFVS